MPPCGDHALCSRSGLPRKSPILGTLHGVHWVFHLCVLICTAVTHLRTPDMSRGVLRSSADAYREFP